MAARIDTTDRGKLSYGIIWETGYITKYDFLMKKEINEPEGGEGDTVEG